MNPDTIHQHALRHDSAVDFRVPGQTDDAPALTAYVGHRCEGIVTRYTVWFDGEPWNGHRKVKRTEAVQLLQELFGLGLMTAAGVLDAADEASYTLARERGWPV